MKDPKNRLFVPFARAYVRRKLRSNFSDVRMNGLEELRSACKQEPLIFACNHVAWWDPLLLVHLEAQVGFDGYCLMDAVNLKQLRFFSWLGALPLDRTSTRRSYADLNNAIGALAAPPGVLVIFPQGKQTPPHHPLDFKSGLGFLAKRSGARVVPIALRYDYLEGPKQVVHLSCGPPRGMTDQTPQEFVKEIEEAVAMQLKDLEQHIEPGAEALPSLLDRTKRHDDASRLPLGAQVLRLILPGTPK